MRKFMEVKKEAMKTEGETLLPRRATKKSCAYDFYAKKDYVCLPDSVTKIWTDVKCAMKDDDRLDINIRSSSEDENKRIITITPYGRKYEELCEAIL